MIYNAYNDVSDTSLKPHVHLFGGKPGADDEYHDGTADLTSRVVHRENFLHHTFILLKGTGASGNNTFKIQVCPYHPVNQAGVTDDHWVDVATLDDTHLVVTLSNVKLPFIRAVRTAELSASPCTLVVCSGVSHP